MKEEMDFDSGYGLERLKTYAEFKYEIYKLLEQNRKLENNWKELKEFIEEEIEHNVDGVKSFSGYQCKIILDKMQEIESDKNEKDS